MVSQPGKALRSLLTALLIFEGLAAIFGGGILVLDPSGGRMHLDVGMLSDTPFGDYLVPGLWLLLVNGVGQLAAGVWTGLGRPHAGLLGMLFGILLMNWIAVQVAWLGLEHWLQPAMFVVGLVELGVGSRVHAHRA